MKEEFLIETEIDGKAFGTHTVFHDFVLLKAWKRPVTWAVIMAVFSVICFSLKGRDGSIIFGSLLAAMSVLFPAAYFFAYFYTVKKQVKKIDSDENKIRYETKVNNEGFSSGFGKFKWDDLHKVYFHKGFIYVYVESRQAFLLPASDKELCDFIKSKIKVSEK